MWTNSPKVKLDISGLRMDGVVESAMALWGCKVLFSFLCLPAFKASVSSVGLCCISLLLFTDLSATAFLLYLWSGAPKLNFFHPSTDVIALRSVIFLNKTYEGVLMLTPLLVVVELLIRRLWGGESETLLEEDYEAKKVVEREIWETGGRQREEERYNAGLLKALGFLSCLMLWLMCGTYAGFSWRHELVVVRSCLEGGNLLSMCLPCLLTTTSPVTGQLFWAPPAAILLLAITAVVNLTVAKPTSKTFDPELTGCVDNGDTLQKTSTAPVCVSNNCSVDLEDRTNSCAIHSAHNNRQPAHAKPELSSQGTAQESNADGVTLVLQLHRTAPHPRSSPHSKGELITGLLCALLVCVSPTVLSTNVLLVSSVDTLAAYALKHLLAPAAR